MSSSPTSCRVGPPRHRSTSYNTTPGSSSYATSKGVWSGQGRRHDETQIAANCRHEETQMMDASDVLTTLRCMSGKVWQARDDEETHDRLAESEVMLSKVRNDGALLVGLAVKRAAADLGCAVP